MLDEMQTAMVQMKKSRSRACLTERQIKGCPKKVPQQLATRGRRVKKPAKEPRVKGQEKKKLPSQSTRLRVSESNGPLQFGIFPAPFVLFLMTRTQCSPARIIFPALTFIHGGRSVKGTNICQSARTPAILSRSLAGTNPEGAV